MRRLAHHGPRRWAVATAVILGAAALALGIAEAALRVAGVAYPNLYRHDRLLGNGLKPGASAVFEQEGHAEVVINSAGYRDLERTIAKPPDTLRIAVLGDSYIEALQVPLESSFGPRLQEALSRCDDLGAENVEVLSFGVSGYGTAQQLLMLGRDVWPYAPDVVVLAFTAGNDVRNNSSALEPDRDRPFFDLVGSDLVLSDPLAANPAFRRNFGWRGTLKVFLYDHFRVVQVLRRAYGIMRAGQSARAGGPRAAEHPRRAAAIEPTAVRAALTFSVGVRAAGWLAADGPGAGAAAERGHAIARVNAQTTELGLDAEVYREPATPEWKRAWMVTEALIARMSAEVHARGGSFVLVGLTSGIQVHPDREVRERARRALGVEDLYYPERRLGRLADELGITAVMLAPRLASQATASGDFFHGFDNTALGTGHWNETGHRAAAGAVAEVLCDELGSREAPGRTTPGLTTPVDDASSAPEGHEP